MRALGVAALALAAGCAGSAPGPASRPPNFLFLLADDQRPDTIAALGNPAIRTPNLDRLVREGTAFTRALSPNPVCVPSRAEILTGASGFRNGVLPGFGTRLNPGLAFWPATLREAGYHTWYVGKWHTEGRPSAAGFEEARGLFGGTSTRPPAATDARGRPVTGYANWMFQSDGGRLYPEKGVGLSPDISRAFADAAIEFLRLRPEKPFFLHVNFTAPHDPLFWPPGFENAYDPGAMALPPNFLPEHPFDHGNARGRDERLWPFPRPPEEVRFELAVYYAVLSHLDAQIGRVLAALEETGQAERTVVLYSSDHGLAIGSHGLRGKQNMYEHTAGVPLIFRGPGIPRGKRSDAQVYLRDLFPTACELAGVPVPRAVEGRSLVPLLRGEAREIHPAGFGYFTDTQRMIRTDRWKLIRYPKAGRAQLFDLAEDPHERRDLAGEPAHAAVRAELEARLAAWQRDVGDPLAR